MRLFHVSENGDIEFFQPRPSPSEFEGLKGNVVFAVSEKLLHNYLLPRECPRVTYYKSPTSIGKDHERFFNGTTAEYIINIEERWIPVIEQTTIYCYELPVDSFFLLDPVAGYYISYLPVKPVNVFKIENPLQFLSMQKNLECRSFPEIRTLGKAVCKSSLNFSLIRMKNSLPADES